MTVFIDAVSRLLPLTHIHTHTSRKRARTHTNHSGRENKTAQAKTIFSFPRGMKVGTTQIFLNRRSPERSGNIPVR